jgi:hypothetical protein
LPTFEIPKGKVCHPEGCWSGLNFAGNFIAKIEKKGHLWGAPLDLPNSKGNACDCDTQTKTGAGPRWICPVRVEWPGARSMGSPPDL